MDAQFVFAFVILALFIYSIIPWNCTEGFTSKITTQNKLKNPTISGTITLDSPAIPASNQLGYCYIGTLGADASITKSYKSYFKVQILYPGVYLLNLNLKIQYVSGSSVVYGLSNVTNNALVSGEFTSLPNGSVSSSSIGSSSLGSLGSLGSMGSMGSLTKVTTPPPSYGTITLSYTQVLSVKTSKYDVFVVADLRSGVINMLNGSNLYVTRIA